MKRITIEVPEQGDEIRGFDVVLDIIYGPPAEAAMRALIGGIDGLRNFGRHGGSCIPIRTERFDFA